MAKNLVRTEVFERLKRQRQVVVDMRKDLEKAYRSLTELEREYRDAVSNPENWK